jgi:hypothetical protein
MLAALGLFEHERHPAWPCRRPLQNAAKRLQLEIGLLCESAPSLRVHILDISSRSGVTASQLIGNSCRVRFDDTAILNTGYPARYR